MTAPTFRTYTILEYLSLEQEEGDRYAFYNGIVEKMAGGTIAHNRISRNVLIELGTLIASRDDLEIFGPDQKIYLPKYHFYVYPDVVVVAGEPVQTEAEAHALVNPLLIVETLSAGTERYDRGQKFVEYQSLPSFKEYVLLRQDTPEALVFFRETPNSWRSTEAAGLDKIVSLQSIGCALRLAAVYAKVEFSLV